MHNRYEYDYILTKYLSAKLAQRLNSDEDPGNVLGSQLEARGKIYTTLLNNYSTITHTRNILKEIHKWLFFWGVAAVGVTVTILGSQIVQKVLTIENERLFIDSVPILITAFVSFLSVVIGVPLTITHFLFNIAEDNNITSTIHDTQLHDFKEIELLKDRYIDNGKSSSQTRHRQQRMAFDDDMSPRPLFDEEDFERTLFSDGEDDFATML